MIDIDEGLRRELNRLVEVDPRRDWDDIVSRAGVRRERARRRATAFFAVAAAAAAVSVATPLGSAIAQSLDEFSAWLTGEPGSPVSQREQREFDAVNARSWLGFPKGTELRRLITAKAGDSKVELLGFRSGSSTLCLRLTVTGKSRASKLSCAPLAELRRAGGPARVILADYPLGKGSKTAWYGIDRVRSANVQITAGIAADGVTAVVLEDGAGRHEVPARSNAFLYVARQPGIGQRVTRVWARTAAGLVPVPFAPALTGFGGGRGAAAGTVPAAPPIERRVTGGRIGWLDTHEPRGEPLDVLPARTRSSLLGWRLGRVVFGRVVAPDPDRPVRLVMTLNSHRRGGPAAGLCTMLVARGGGGGGCAPYPEVFAHTPIPSEMSGSGSGAFVTVSGFASDDVARIEAVLSDGQRASVPLKDNAFLVDLPRAGLPARLVAYDAEGRVIGVGEPLRDFPGRPGGSSPAKGRATSVLDVAGPNGAHAELLVGPSTSGGECIFIRHFVDRRHAGVSVSCGGPGWTGDPVQLSSQPPFVGGRVRSDIATVRIDLADGTSTTVTPTRGYVLWAASDLSPDKAATGAEGLRQDGTVAGRVSFRPPHG